MKNSFAVSCLVSIFAFLLNLGTPVSAQNLVQNGSFEQQDISGSFSRRLSNDTRITGWTIGGEVDHVNDFWVAQEGGQSLDLNGLAKGKISQDIATTPGRTYSLTFHVAGNPDSNILKKLKVSFGGSSKTITFDNTRYSRGNMGWRNESLIINATGTTTTLTFESLVEGIYGPALDNVTIRESSAPWIGYDIFGNSVTRYYNARPGGDIILSAEIPVCHAVKVTYSQHWSGIWSILGLGANPWHPLTLPFASIAEFVKSAHANYTPDTRFATGPDKYWTVIEGELPQAQARSWKNTVTNGNEIYMEYVGDSDNDSDKALDTSYSVSF